MRTIFVTFLLSLLAVSSNADRLVMPKEKLIRYGFKLYKNIDIRPRLLLQNITSEDNYSIHSLSWPIEFKRFPEQFIGNMHQYQSFTKPSYYHSGVDILALAEQEIMAPVSGIIEGGYYSYTDEPEGTSEKFFLPLKEALKNEEEIPWGKKYFEIAVTDVFGNRFEFHHVNSETLPIDIYNKILKGEQNVNAGEVIGHVIEFGSKRKKIDMTHTHYNIQNNDHHYINPFFLSNDVADQTPPVIKGIYAVKKAFCYRAPELVKFEDSSLSTENYIVVNTIDYISSDQLEKAPVLIKAVFDNGEVFKWDFTKKIVDKQGNRPDIRDVYLDEYCNMKVKVEMRASRSFDFYFKIPVAPEYSGSVVISVFDQSENVTSQVIQIKSKITEN